MNTIRKSVNFVTGLIASLMITSTTTVGAAERAEMNQPEASEHSVAGLNVLSAADDTVSFHGGENYGLAFIQDFSGAPNDSGVLGTYTLEIPEFIRGILYSDRKWGRTNWRGGGNQFFSNVLFGDYDNVLEHRRVFRGAFLVFQLRDGEYLALLPISSDKTMSWIQAEDTETLMVYYGTLGTAPVEGDVPLVAWSKSESIYDACRKVWELALNSEFVKGRTDWRHNKHYHEVFKYLGWCSWEEYKKDLSCDLLVETARKIEQSGLPVRYMLIDDGHQQGIAENMQLKSFAPDPEKFPNGWDPLLDMRSEDGIKWMGIWHSFAGLQNTLHPENDFGDLNDHFMTLNPRNERDVGLFVKPNETSSQLFYDALVGSVKAYGFDFMKTDYQMRDLWWYSGTENAVRATTINLQAMESAVHRKLPQGLINCMAHNQVCIFNTRHSAITRISRDYRVGDASMSKFQLWQSFNNTPWFCQTVWGDHDMFHSNDPYAGRIMSVSKAMSGGPIYLSDNPAEFIAEYVTPLAYEDGELLRPLAPGAPLPESIFLDPMRERVAYRTIAPLANGSAAIVLYNLFNGEQFDYYDNKTYNVADDITVVSHVSPADYEEAANMIQPFNGKWKVPEEGLVAYDFYEGSGFKLDEKTEFELHGFTDKLLILSPIQNNWAVIGRADKFLSAVAVASIEYADEHLRVTLKESGPLVVWSGAGAPQSEGLDFVSLGNGFYKADLPVGNRNVEINIVR